MLLGILLILTPWYIFPVCGVGRNAPAPGEPIGHHTCFRTLKAETVLGAITILISIMPVLWPLRKIVLGASLGSLVIAVLVILFPTAITGLCKMPTMACRVGTLPALVTVGILIGIAAAIGLISSRKIT